MDCGDPNQSSLTARHADRYGERLQTAGGDRGAQFLRLQVAPHLAAELLRGDCADQEVVLSSINARALSDSQSLPIVHQ